MTDSNRPTIGERMEWYSRQLNALDEKNGELIAEVANLRAENAALRAGWETSYREGFNDCGIALHPDDYNPNGWDHENWNASAAKRRLDEIGEGKP